MERWRELVVRPLLVATAAGVIALVVGWQRDVDRCEGAAKRVAAAAQPDRAGQVELGRDLRTLRGDCGGSDEPLAAGAVLLKAGRADEATMLARALVREEPDNYRAWLTLAGALRESDPAASPRALDRARKLNPRYSSGG